MSKVWMKFGGDDCDGRIKPITVVRWPEWARSGDYIETRRGRHFLVSQHETEPRWRRLLRWLGGVR